MDISFKESPWYLQALIFVALAVLLLAAGEYMPGIAGDLRSHPIADPARTGHRAESGSERVASLRTALHGIYAGDELRSTSNWTRSRPSFLRTRKPTSSCA